VDYIDDSVLYFSSVYTNELWEVCWPIRCERCVDQWAVRSKM